MLAVVTAAVVMACATGLAAERLLAPGQDAPRLKTVSSATLARMGLSLAPATQPPYCALGWVRAGVGGCPISRQDAEKAAMPFPSTATTESVLARATVTRPPRDISDRLAWVVVRRATLASSTIACVQGPSEGVPAPCPRPRTMTQIVVVDASTGQVVTVLVSGAGPGPIAPAGLRPVRGERLPGR